MRKNIEWLKEYIQNEISNRGLDENKQIRIDFAGLGEDEEIVAAASELGFEAQEAENDGLGVYWIYKPL